jgi:hypothetical protein
MAAKRLEQPAVYLWQGVTRGRLDRSLDMILAGNRNAGVRRVITFGEFEDMYREVYYGADQDRQKILGVAPMLSMGFTPEDRPVFWRIAMAHVHIHQAIVRIALEHEFTVPSSKPELLKFLSIGDSSRFDWASLVGKGRDQCDDAVDAALTYLSGRLLPHLQGRWNAEQREAKNARLGAA